MGEVIQLRRNNSYRIGDIVTIKGGRDQYEVAHLGYGDVFSAEENLIWEGNLVNASEFVQLKVNGVENATFVIHTNYIQPAQRLA